jgi:hypothetical protein
MEDFTYGSSLHCHRSGRDDYRLELVNPAGSNHGAAVLMFDKGALSTHSRICSNNVGCSPTSPWSAPQPTSWSCWSGGSDGYQVEVQRATSERCACRALDTKDVRRRS